jgi:hypothetical protein
MKRFTIGLFLDQVCNKLDPKELSERSYQLRVNNNYDLLCLSSLELR